jgi:tRNA 2-selenouridine synthase
MDEFLNGPGFFLDVRSPAEYIQGHIPGAYNLPLFSDHERAIVGTLYKQAGKEKAIEEGLRLVGPKLADFVTFAKQRIQGQSAKLYCWRGGMRSQSMAWLLNTAGIKTTTLHRGYKTFRTWALKMMEQPRNLKVLGGLTGTGKTAILKELKNRGEQVLDLEDAAHHLGSSYGMLSQAQPSNEQFENSIALQWARAEPTRPLWIEDESRLIGKCKIPDKIFQLIRSSPLIYIECSLEERLENLLKHYGKISPEDLIKATERIGKRLGNARKNDIIRLIQTGNLTQAIEIALQYYDRTYAYGLSLRPQKIIKISGKNFTQADWAIACQEALLMKSCNPDLA